MIVFYRNGNSQKWQVSGNGKRFDGFSGEEDSSPAIVGLRNGLDKVGIVKVCLNYFEISWKLMTTITICHYHHDNHHHLSLSSSQPPPLSLSSSQRPPSVTIIITTTTICHYHHSVWMLMNAFLRTTRKYFPSSCPTFLRKVVSVSSSITGRKVPKQLTQLILRTLCSPSSRKTGFLMINLFRICLTAQTILGEQNSCHPKNF